MKILVSEDEVMILKSIEFKLKKEGFEVTTALNGKIPGFHTFINSVIKDLHPIFTFSKGFRCHLPILLEKLDEV